MLRSIARCLSVGLTTVTSLGACGDATGCSDGSSPGWGGSGNQGGTGGVNDGGTNEGGEGGAPNCTIDPPGESFDFEITNIGTSQLSLFYGCGATLPIELDTPSGPQGISP